MNKAGIEYTRPKVRLLQHSGLGVAEFAGRTAYDSFSNSENEAVYVAGTKRYFKEPHNEAEGFIVDMAFEDMNEIEDSELLNNLAWVYHHHSVIEHATVSYLIEGTSRGVLQEHARHRIQSITVRSTRYTMSNIINAFLAAYFGNNDIVIESRKEEFIKIVKSLDMFVVKSNAYIDIEINTIYDKLIHQMIILGKEEFIKIATVKENFGLLSNNKFPAKDIFKRLQAGKKKRNVGDSFKHIVTDNWKVDMVVTFNLRALKNYFDLRDSGAAYFQIRALAEEMKAATPLKYLKLIDKNLKDK